MKRIGKQGKINIKANKKLKEIYSEQGISYCEAQLEGCMDTFGLSWHHRNKRVWYYDKPELLGSFNETILVCASCHPKLEADKELTKQKFNYLRK